MRRSPVMLLMLLMLGGWLLGFDPAPAQASCAEMPSPESALKRSDAVFSGIVLSVKELNQSKIRSSADPVEVTFRVTEVWKGVNSDRVTVRTTAHSASGFVAGKPYIVYADKTLTGLKIGMCARTAELSHASDDLAALGKGKVPPPSQELKERIRSNPAGMALFWAGTALAVLAAAVLVYLWRRSRSRKGER